jgi:uncharacterized repeat protein (TIGR01451 family)
MLSIFVLHVATAIPFIVFDKKLSDDTAKVGDTVHMILTVLNLGDAAASNLHIDDVGIPLEQWNFRKSAGDLRWSSLEPGANISHVFHVTPKIAGNLRQASARLRYVSDGEKKIVMSSQVFWFESRSTRSIGAKSNLSGYAIVVGLAFASVSFPFAIWWTQKPIGATFVKPKST